MTDQRQPESVIIPVAGPVQIELLEPMFKMMQSWPPLFPSKVGDPIRPLAIGTDRALAALLVSPDDDGVKLIKETMRRYCKSTKYALAMSMIGAMRHALDGTPVEPVSEQHRIHRMGGPKRPRQAPSIAAQNSASNTIEAIMVAVKALKITAVLPPDQLKPSDATSVVLTVTTPEGAKATATISGKSYRRAVTQIATIGADQAVVVLQGSMKKPGEIEGAGLAVTARKTD